MRARRDRQTPEAIRAASGRFDDGQVNIQEAVMAALQEAFPPIRTGRFESRLFDLPTAAAYISMGDTRAREWLARIGARRKFGAAVRYDRRVIDEALDAMEADDFGEV